MENDNEQRKIVPVSMRIYSDDREMYKRIREETALPTDAQVFAQLVQTFYDPIRVKDETADLRRQLEEANAHAQQQADLIATLQAQADQNDKTIQDLQQQLTGAQNHAAEEANRLQLEYEAKAQALQEQHAPKPGEYRLSIPPDYYKALQLVAARESRRRGQPWTPSHVVSFFIYSRFIKGSLNGDLRSLTDQELQQAGISLTPQRQEVSL